MGRDAQGAALVGRGDEPEQELGSDVVEGRQALVVDDPAVLALAAAEGRILVTNNSRNFAPLLREWAEAGRPHGGCVLIWTLGHHEFGAILHGLRRLLAERPEQVAWQDIVMAL